MTQYRTGTVTVENGSQTVQLLGGDATQLLAGDWFYVTAEGHNGAHQRYVLAATPTEPDEFTLTEAWAGDTGSGLTYVVHRDFTASGLPLLSGGEAELPSLWNEVVAALDATGIVNAGTFQGLTDTFLYTGLGKQVVAVRSAADGLEARDLGFLQRAFTELAPNNVTNRLVHYSALLGTFNSSGGRVSQANDISGNSRHATADSVGPLLVGEAGRASYGMNFESSSEAGDDVKMIATVPANSTGMFLFFIGRCDQRHAGSQNLWKTAHNGSVDSQTAGDIELAPASSGNTMNLRISTSAGSGQLIPLGPYKNGLPFILCLNIFSGAITGWVQGQGELTATEFSASYDHGSGFDSDRVRLGLSPDFQTAHTIHEFLLSSASQSASTLRRLMIWGYNQYLRSPLIQDEPDPMFVASPNIGGHPLRNWRQPLVVTDGTDITEIFRASYTLSTPNEVTARESWGSVLFTHTGDGAFNFILPATVPAGWWIEIEQQSGSSGSIGVTFDSGASNQNGFTESVGAGERLLLQCKSNSDGASATFDGYSRTIAGTFAVELTPGDNHQSVSTAAPLNVLVHYTETLTEARTVTIAAGAFNGPHIVWVVHEGEDFDVDVVDPDSDPIVTLSPGQMAEIAVVPGGAYLLQHGPIGFGALAALNGVGVGELLASAISGQSTLPGGAPASGDMFLIWRAADGLLYKVAAGDVGTGGGGSGAGEILDPIEITGTTYTLIEGNNAAIHIVRNSNQNLALTIPKAIAKGFHVPLDSATSGEITIAIEDGAGSINGGSSLTVTGTGRLGTIFVRANSTGDAPEVRFEGESTEPTQADADHDHNDKVLSRAILKDYAETVATPTISSGALTLDVTTANVFFVTLTANVTSLTISGDPPSGTLGNITLILVQGSGPFTVDWGSGVDHPGGSAPTLSSGNGDIDVFTLVKRVGSTNWLLMTGGQDFS